MKFLLKDSVVYGLGGAVSRLTFLVTFPLLARAFSVSEFGVFDTINTAINFLAILLVFGQDSAIARFYYEYDSDDERKELISQSLIFQCGLTVISVLTAIFLTPYILSFLAGTMNKVELWLAILQVPFTVLLLFSQNILKWTFRRNAYLLVTVGSVFLTMALLLISILCLEPTFSGVLSAYLIAKLVFSLLGLYLCREYIRVPKNLRYLPQVLHFAIPIGLVCTIGAFVPPMQRAILSENLSLESLGYFAAGAKVAILINLPIEAFQTAWGPFSLSIYKEESANKTYSAALKIYVFLLGSTLMVQAALAKFAIELLTSPEYLTGSTVVFPIAAAYAIQAVGKVTSLGIVLSKKTIVTVYAYLIFLICFLFLTQLMTQSYGLMGVSVAMAISYLIKSLCETFFSHLTYKIPWPFWRISAYTLLTAISGLYIAQLTDLSLSLTLVATHCIIGLMLLVDKNDYIELRSKLC